MSNYPIAVKIIADSASPGGARLTTFELEYPRYLHAEMLTHRVFSKNSQSSRAVPVKKTIVVNVKPVTPLIWGQNVPGMQSKGELTGIKLRLAKFTWRCAANTAFALSNVLGRLGLHKQWANRITEPFSTIKVVLSSTDFANFLWLRLDEVGVQPEMYKLAADVKQAYDLSIPVQLEAGQWHTPYVTNKILENEQVFFDVDGAEVLTEEALKISASCCAQASYRNLDESIKKAEDIFAKLFSGDKPHLSPTEHQGRVMRRETCMNTDVNYSEAMQYLKATRGVTAVSKEGKYLSGNLTGFCQLRQLLGQKEQMFNFLKEDSDAS